MTFGAFIAVFVARPGSMSTTSFSPSLKRQINDISDGRSIRYQ